MTDSTERVSLDIDAPLDVVWEVVREVEIWPRWMSSMRSVERLGAPGLDVGRRFRVTQPGMPPLVWSVTDVEAPHRWSWEQRAVGGSTSAVHELSGGAGPGTRLVLSVTHTGPVRRAFGAITGRRTRRFMQIEADAVRSVSEQRQRERAGDVIPDASTPR